MQAVVIGISCGDLNGIGLEVTLKALQKKSAALESGQLEIRLYCREDVLFAYHALMPDFPPVGEAIQAINPWQDRAINLQPGALRPEIGQAALDSFSMACDDLESGRIHALVTAPLHKANLPAQDGQPFSGHTGYLSQRFHGKALMVLSAGTTRVALATEHVPIKQLDALLGAELLTEKLHAFHQALQVDFGISNPSISVLGLDPHAGDHGAIGEADRAWVKPVIQHLQDGGMSISGPQPADGFFGRKGHETVDGVMAMYHDQGLIPFKLLHFGQGVNSSHGLSHVRTSPDHGVAFDIAGEGKADAGSMLAALDAAIAMVQQRKFFHGQ